MAYQLSPACPVHYTAKSPVEALVACAQVTAPAIVDAGVVRKPPTPLPRHRHWYMTGLLLTRKHPHFARSRKRRNSTALAVTLCPSTHHIPSGHAALLSCVHPETGWRLLPSPLPSRFTSCFPSFLPAAALDSLPISSNTGAQSCARPSLTLGLNARSWLTQQSVSSLTVSLVP